MKINKFLFPSLLVCSGLAFIYRLFARTVAKPVSEKPDTRSTSYDEIDSYIEGQMRLLKIPGVSLTIVEGDQIAHLRGFGCARPGGEAPAPQTPFFIGSLTKSFTALAIMQLVEAGKIALDAPVQHYLPWFRMADPDASAQLTVRHLLNQTSGLPMSLGLKNLADLGSHANTLEDLVRSISTLVLTRPVGSKFEYSNMNYNVLGLILEAASGMCYADYIQQHIFDPLDMRHSYTSKTEAQQDNLAVGYRYWFGRPIPVPDLSIPSGSLPSGQLISCAEDMSHYLIAFLNGGRYQGNQIISAKGITEMVRGVAEWKEMGFNIGFYGMGWIIQDFKGTRIVSHSGDVPDFGAFMALVPAQKKAIVILFNANHAMMKITKDELGLGAAQRLAGIPPTPQIFGFAPWLMRSMLLIPVIQCASILATRRSLIRLRFDPAYHPSRGRIWRQHILFGNSPNLLISLSLLPTLGKMDGFIKLFMPDFFWISWICGSFAVVWTFVRTGLVLRILQKTHP